MKTIQLLLLLLLFPLVFHAQKTLTGLWTGVLSNDSNTVRKDQSYEIALTQYKEKVYGYTRSSFIVNDTLYYIVKRVKGTIDGDVCEVKDDEVISSNFRGRVDKGIKVTTVFRMNQQDSTWRLAGEWKTNKTKNYYSITGKVALREEKNLDNSKIFPHLEELKMADEVAFYKESKKPVPPPVVKAPAKEETKVSRKETAKKETTSPVVVKETKKTKKETRKEEEQVAKKNNNPVIVEETSAKDSLSVNSIAANKTDKTDQKATIPVEVAKKADPPPATNSSTASANKSTAPAITEKVVAVNTVPSETKKETAPVIVQQQPPAPIVSLPKKAAAAEYVAQRKIVAPQIVNFVSDSLELALYDNGEVDGDTVSILLNGEIILAKQGLRTVAIKKTIYIDPSTDEITLLLYAENLGKYPPNTGLLVVHDGEDVYQVRFSADLQQNASVIFRRKKN